MLPIFHHNKKEKDEGIVSSALEGAHGRDGVSFFMVTPRPATALW